MNKTTQPARIIGDCLYTGVSSAEAVRRINAHDDLVAALRYIANGVGDGDIEYLAKLARAALAKVQA
jgi:hypothetical protein